MSRVYLEEKSLTADQAQRTKKNRTATYQRTINLIARGLLDDSRVEDVNGVITCFIAFLIDGEIERNVRSILCLGSGRTTTNKSKPKPSNELTDKFVGYFFHK